MESKRKRPAKASTMQLVSCFKAWHKEYIKPKPVKETTVFNTALGNLRGIL